MKIYFDKPEQKLNFTYRTNFKTLLLDCERLKTKVIFSIHDVRTLTRFTCVDINKRVLNLDNFYINGDLIYYKKNQFTWCTFALDNIDYVEISENVPNLDFFKGVAA